MTGKRKRDEGIHPAATALPGRIRVSTKAVPTVDLGVWSDVSSFSRDLSDAQCIPYAFQARFYALRVTVHRIRGIEDQWFVSTNPVFFDNSALLSKGIDEAKAEALSMVEDRVRLVLDALTVAKGKKA